MRTISRSRRDQPQVHPVQRAMKVLGLLLALPVLASAIYGLDILLENRNVQGMIEDRTALLSLAPEDMAERIVVWNGQMGMAYGPGVRHRVLCDEGDASGAPMTVEEWGRTIHACSIANARMWNAMPEVAPPESPRH